MPSGVAEACAHRPDRHRRGLLLGSLRRRGRNRDGSAADPLARLRRARGHRHKPDGHHPDRRRRHGHASPLRERPPARGSCCRRARRRRCDRGNRLAAARPRAGGRVRIRRLAHRQRDPPGDRLTGGEVVLAAALGLVGGVIGGMLGVGGGIVFVPALAIVLGLEQVDAEATSLLAVIAVGAVGAWRQYGYGNLRPRDGALMGILSLGGVLAGVALANLLPERALKLLFAAFMLYMATTLFRRAARV